MTSDELFEILRGNLISDFYTKGKPLPTLRELEVQYGLGKDAINRVFAALEGEGLITRNGRRRYPVLRHRSEDRIIAVEHIFRRNEHPFYSAVDDGIVDTFLYSEYGIHLFTHRESDESGLSKGTVMATMLERGILKGIMLPFGAPATNDLSVFKNLGVPVCSVGIEPGPGVILLDLEHAALQGTHHIIKLGFDHVGIVCAQNIAKDIAVKGYNQALELADLPRCEEDIIDCNDFIPNSVATYNDHGVPHEAYIQNKIRPIIEGARLAILHRINIGHLPRGLFITDEYLAIGVVRALLEAGLRVPQDVALVSNMSSGNWAMELTGLTNTQFDGYACGIEAAHFMLDILEGRRSSNDRLVLKTRLIKGISCGEMDEVNDEIASIDVMP